MNRRPVRAWVVRSGEVFDAPSANKGLELRHTTYGYALINAARQRVNGRNDLTLAEIAEHLDS